MNDHSGPNLSSIGGRCSFGTMDWYCALAAGHDGPHESDVLSPPAPRTTAELRDAYGRCVQCGLSHGIHRYNCPNDAFTNSQRSSNVDEIIEQVAAQVHADWMTAKRAAGVETRKLESGEELMVPYADLSEQAKDLDRGTVRSVLLTLGIVGYRVVPQ